MERNLGILVIISYRVFYHLTACQIIARQFIDVIYAKQRLDNQGYRTVFIILQQTPPEAVGGVVRLKQPTRVKDDSAP